MAGFLIKIREFLRRVRRSDDREKKRWMIFFSAIGIVAVVALWMAYLNVTLPKSSAGETSATPEEIGTSPSFFKILGMGWESVWNSIESNANGIGGNLESQWLNLMEQAKRTNDVNLEKPSN